jgi:hypothetical protein
MSVHDSFYLPGNKTRIKLSLRRSYQAFSVTLVLEEHY